MTGKGPGTPDSRNCRHRAGRHRSQCGYIFATLAVTLAVLVGCIGFAVDIGMLYIFKSEAQNFVDSAALAAAMELDGSALGITEARSRVTANKNRWSFGGSTFPAVVTEFSTGPAGPWEGIPANPVNYRYARVTTSMTSPLLFLPVIVSDRTGAISARAIAAQVPKTRFINGVFPYSPFVHNPSDPHYGFTKGTQYTLRWPNNMNPSKSNGCPADEANPAVMQMKYDAGDSVQGFIDDSSASYLREAVLTDAVHVGNGYEIGTPLYMASGNKQTEGDAVAGRVRQDPDSTSTTYAQYVAQNGAKAAGRRLVIVPVNAGPADNYKIVGFAQFFLLPPKNYLGNPQDPFCAEYVGSALANGSNGGASSGGGAYAVRLVE